MDGKWDNLFWQLPAPDAATQREVNTTKNFLKTLQDTAPVVERQIVELFWNATSSNNPPGIGHITYEREYTGGAEDVDTTYLIGISRNGRSLTKSDIQDVEDQGGQADASLVVETDEGTYQFVLEVKTGAEALSTAQLGKYCNEFGISREHVATVQWNAILEELQSVQSLTDDRLSTYLIAEFAAYLRHQDLNKNVAQYRHSGYEKSVTLAPGPDEPVVEFRAKESGSSDVKTLTGKQYRDLFSEAFATLGLDVNDRRRIFIEREYKLFEEVVAENAGSEIGATDVGFSGGAEYRLIIDGHGDDGGLFKLQEMGEDGRFAEFPNTYHFMLTEQELVRVLSPEHGPGFSETTLDALMIQLELEEAI